MTDEILKLAREHFADPDGSLEILTPELTSFYRAAFNAGIEAAAKVCCEEENHAMKLSVETNDDLASVMLKHHAAQSYRCAEAIRTLEMKP